MRVWSTNLLKLLKNIKVVSKTAKFQYETLWSNIEKYFFFIIVLSKKKLIVSFTVSRLKSYTFLLNSFPRIVLTKISLHKIGMLLKREKGHINCLRLSYLTSRHVRFFVHFLNQKCTLIFEKKYNNKNFTRDPFFSCMNVLVIYFCQSPLFRFVRVTKYW